MKGGLESRPFPLAMVHPDRAGFSRIGVRQAQGRRRSGLPFRTLTGEEGCDE